MYTDQYPGGSQSISEGFVHFKFRGYIIGDIRAIRQERGPFIFKTPLTKLHFVLTSRTVVIITEADDCCPSGKMPKAQMIFQKVLRIMIMMKMIFEGGGDPGR